MEKVGLLGKSWKGSFYDQKALCIWKTLVQAEQLGLIFINANHDSPQQSTQPRGKIQIKRNYLLLKTLFSSVIWGKGNPVKDTLHISVQHNKRSVFANLWGSFYTAFSGTYIATTNI